MIKSKYILYLSFLSLTVMTFIFHYIPFFWDGTFFSETATTFYNGTYSPLDCPENLDNVTFPIYSTYLYCVWSIFSRSLLVSHLALLPFLIGSVYEFYKFSRKFLNDQYLSMALILLMLQPTFITQAILMAYDIPLLYLILVCINLLLEKRFLIYSLIIPVVSLYSIRGLFIGASFFLLMSFLHPSGKKSDSILFSLKHHLLCITAVIAWFIYHKAQTGWLLFSPIHENTDEHVHSISMMFRHTCFVIWKVLDNGQVILWTILLPGIFIFFRKKINSQQLKTLLLILFTPLFISSLFMIPVSNPIGHRYFLFTYVLLIPVLCFLFQHWENKLLSGFLYSVCCIALISGNFWLYPEKYGNGWDSTLKVLPYFSAKEEMDDFITRNKIDPGNVGTQYPLIANTQFSHLAQTGISYQNVWSGPIDKFDYFLYTNVINTDIHDQIEKVKKEWLLLKRIESGEVYIELYTKKELLFFQF